MVQPKSTQTVRLFLSREKDRIKGDTSLKHTSTSMNFNAAYSHIISARMAGRIRAEITVFISKLWKEVISAADAPSTLKVFFLR